MNFKSLKKKVVFSLMVCAMLLCVSGGTVVQAKRVSAETYLKKMNKAFSKVKSYDVKYSFPLDMSLTVNVNDYQQTEDTAITTKISQKVINNPKFIAKIVVNKTNRSDEGEIENTEKIYLKTNSDGNVDAYGFINGRTTPNKVSLTASDASSLIKSVDISTLLNTKVVDENYNLNGKKVIKLTAEVSCSDMTDLVRELPLNLSDMEDEFKVRNYLLYSFKDSTVKFTYYIDKKTYLPVKVTSNLGSFLEKYTNSLLAIYNIPKNSDGISISSTVKIHKASTTMTFSGFDKTKTIKFPSSCK